MKLLTSFIEYQGLSVNKIIDYQETEITEEQGIKYILSDIPALGFSFPSCQHYKLKRNNGDFVRGENNSYFKLLASPLVSYELTNKKDINHKLKPLLDQLLESIVNGREIKTIENDHFKITLEKKND